GHVDERSTHRHGQRRRRSSCRDPQASRQRTTRRPMGNANVSRLRCFDNRRTKGARLTTKQRFWSKVQQGGTLTDVAEDASAPHPYPTEMPADRIAHLDRARGTVRPLDGDLAAGYLIADHYSGSRNDGACGLRDFGIYHNRTLRAVAADRRPTNPRSWPSITSSAPAPCLELKRLFLHARRGRNAETWFMAKAHDLLRRDGIELIQSFADGRLGNGTIYKAANFTYHGHTETRFFRHNETGHFYHGVPFTDAAGSAIIPRNLMLVRGQLTP